MSEGAGGKGRKGYYERELAVVVVVIENMESKDYNSEMTICVSK